METAKRSALQLLISAFVLGFGIVAAVRAEDTSQIVSPPLKEYRIIRSVSQDAQLV